MSHYFQGIKIPRLQVRRNCFSSHRSGVPKRRTISSCQNFSNMTLEEKNESKICKEADSPGLS